LHIKEKENDSGGETRVFTKKGVNSLKRKRCSGGGSKGKRESTHEKRSVFLQGEKAQKQEAFHLMESNKAGEKTTKKKGIWGNGKNVAQDKEKAIWVK